MSLIVKFKVSSLISFSQCARSEYIATSASIDQSPAHDSERDNGLIDVALLGIIRRWYICDHISMLESPADWTSLVKQLSVKSVRM